MKKEIAEILIVMLKARREHANHYIYNQDMRRECDLLDGEIKALEEIKE